MTNHILIASTSSTLRQSIYLDLIQAGYQIFEAAGGQETLATMESQDDLDLLLIDAPLADMDGVHLARMIREISIYRFLPILMLLPGKAKAYESEGLTAGITGYIHQPVTPEKLRTVIHRLLEA